MPDGLSPASIDSIYVTRQLSHSLLDRVLRPYHQNCRYLQEARLEHGGLASRYDITAYGRFSIPASCYIDATGHFNAVEFNMCYNQLAYMLIGGAIELDLMPVFHDWSLEDFTRRQLRDFLIVSFESEFRAPIQAQSFEGSIALKRVRASRAGIFIKTECRFHDAAAGLAQGHVLTAVVDSVAH